MRTLLLSVGLLLVAANGLPAQDRDTKVRNDQKTFQGSNDWIYNNLDEGVRAARDGQTQALTLALPEGWRRRSDISWRTSTWNLRRMGLGGMALTPLSDQERREAKLPADSMALRAKHVAEFGEHAVAKRAGFKKGDILIDFDGQRDLTSETQLLAYALQRKRPGDVVAVTIVRDGERKTLSFAQQ